MKLLEKPVYHYWCSYIWATDKRILLGKKEILQGGASLVHLLWHFNLREDKTRRDIHIDYSEDTTTVAVNDA